MLATARREEGEEVCGLPVNGVDKLENLQLTWGLKKFLQPAAPPLREIGHFLVRLNGTSVVDRHAARTKIPACHEGNIRVETTAEGWSIFQGKIGGVNARILPSAARHVVGRALKARTYALFSKRLLFLTFSLVFRQRLLFFKYLGRAGLGRVEFKLSNV